MSCNDAGRLDRRRSVPISPAGTRRRAANNEGDPMQARSTAIILLSLLLSGCAGGDGASRTGRCLYAVEMEYGQMMRWGSCANPPANAIRRLSGGSGAEP
jgi:hypothetical protein